MIRVVVDTNVVVSALLKSESDPALIVSMILNRDITLCLSYSIFTEYHEVLSRNKFKKLDQPSVRRLLQDLKNRAVWVEPQLTLNVIKEDPADNRFLECALEAGADFLITGNNRHFPFKRFREVSIVNPGEFVGLIALSLFNNL